MDFLGGQSVWREGVGVGVKGRAALGEHWSVILFSAGDGAVEANEFLLMEM